MRRARRTNDLWIVASGTSQEGLGPVALARLMPERRVYPAKRCLGTKPGGLELQWCEHLLGHEFLPGPSSHAFEHRTCQHIAHVGIGELGPWFRLQGLSNQRFGYPIAQLIKVELFLRKRLLDELLVGIGIARDAARVLEQLLQGYAHQVSVHGAREFRKHVADRGGPVDLPSLDQHRCNQGRHGFGVGSNVEAIIDGDRVDRSKPPTSDCTGGDDLAIPHHRGRDSREVIARQVRLQDRIEGSAFAPALSVSVRDQHPRPEQQESLQHYVSEHGSLASCFCRPWDMRRDCQRLNPADQPYTRRSCQRLAPWKFSSGALHALW